MASRSTPPAVYVAPPPNTGLILRMGALLVAGAVATAIGIVVSPKDATPAATVNHITVPQKLIQDAVKQGCADTKGKRESDAQCAREALTSKVYTELVDSLARDLQVTVSDATIKADLSQIAASSGGLDALYKSAAQAGVSRARIYDYIRQRVMPGEVQQALTAAKPPSDTVIRTYYTDHPTDFTVIRLEVIVTNNQPVSDEVVRQVRAHPGRFAEFVQTYTIDANTKKNMGQLPPITLTTYNQTLGPKLGPPRAGELMGPLADGGLFELYKVLAVTQTTYAEGAPLIKTLLQKDGSPYAVALLDAALTLQARKVGVSINRKYGVWDYDTSTVVAK